MIALKLMEQHNFTAFLPSEKSCLTKFRKQSVNLSIRRAENLVRIWSFSAISNIGLGKREFSYLHAQASFEGSTSLTALEI